MSDTYNNNIVFYHHPCIDGSVSAWAAFQALGAENTKYIGLNHNQKEYINEDLNEYIEEGDNVYFCDIVPPTVLALERLLEKASKISIYDHHFSAKKRLKGFEHPKCNIIFDMDRSGAGLSWDIFNSDKPRPFLVDLVEAMDLYNIDFTDTREEFFTLAAGIDTLDLVDFKSFAKKFSALCSADDNGLEIIRDLGQTRRSMYLNRIAETLSKITYITCDDIEALGNQKIAFVWEDIHNLSREFWHKFAEFCPEDIKTLMVCHHEKNKNMISISFRGDGGLDVSLAAEEIATKYGINGGGHKRAAAVRFTYDQFNIVTKKWQLPID